MTNFWSQRSAREKLIFFCCLLVGAVFLTSQGVVRPYEALLDSRQAEIQAKEIRLAKYERWAALSAARSNFGDSLEHVRATGGQEEEMSRFLKTVESMARESSIRVTDLKPLPVEQKDSYQEYQVDVQTEASQESLARFLYRLQTSPLFLSVPRFSLASTRGAAGDSRLRMSLTIARILLPAARGPTHRGS